MRIQTRAREPGTCRGFAESVYVNPSIISEATHFKSMPKETGLAFLSFCDSSKLFRLTNANRCMAKARNEPLIKPLVSLKRPCLICVVEEAFPVVGYCFAIFVDYDGRVVVLGASGPLIGNIDLLRVANNYVAIVLESGRASPKGGDSGARGLEKRRNMLEGLEIVP